MKLQGLALAWLRREDWAAWLATDATLRPYEDWLQRMEAAFKRYQDAGVPVVKVTIRPDEFMEWSNANNAGVGSDARAGFSAIKAMELDNSEGKH